MIFREGSYGGISGNAINPRWKFGRAGNASVFPINGETPNAQFRAEIIISPCIVVLRRDIGDDPAALNRCSSLSRRVMSRRVAR